MPRRPLILTNQFVYHVTSRSNNKEWFYLPKNLCWNIFSEALGQVALQYQVHHFHFVLMSNHFHLILETPLANLGDVMRELLTTVSKKIQKQSNRINHVFGARYKWSLLQSSFSVAYVTKYVLRNPIRAGITERVEDYPFSSLNPSSQLPIVSGISPIWSQVPKQRQIMIDWLNQPVHGDLEKQITYGLKKESFSFSTDNNKQKSIRLLQSAYGIHLSL